MSNNRDAIVEESNRHLKAWEEKALTCGVKREHLSICQRAGVIGRSALPREVHGLARWEVGRIHLAVMLLAWHAVNATRVDGSAHTPEDCARAQQEAYAAARERAGVVIGGVGALEPMAQLVERAVTDELIRRVRPPSAEYGKLLILAAIDFVIAAAEAAREMGREFTYAEVIRVMEQRVRARRGTN